MKKTVLVLIFTRTKESHMAALECSQFRTMRSKEPSFPESSKKAAWQRQFKGQWAASAIKRN